MKKTLFLLTILLSLTSCDVEMSHNGDLDGLWQIYELQTDGGEPKDMRYSDISMSVNFNLMCLRKPGVYYSIYCRFENNGSTLRLYDFRIGKHDVSDLPVEDPSELHDFGLFSLDETFKIETLNSSTMVLRSERSVLKLRKY